MTYKAPLTWERLPDELKQRPQWLLARPDARGDLKVPTSVNAKGEAIDGSSTNRDTWMTFERAVQAARAMNLGIGYVCSFDDPFAVVDLDVKNALNRPNEPEEWTTNEQMQRFTRILHACDSYTERSQSGQGLHIWVRGKIGKGVKRDGVEVYSQERFIVCTGDVLWDKPIYDRGDMLRNAVTQMRAEVARATDLVEVESDSSDSELFERASNAANADKFLKLCRGEWQDEFPSQSEADLALMSMFTFYSPSNEQCKRMFRLTALGKREKATKNDRYLNFTLSLIRARQANEKRMLDRIVLDAEEMRAKLALREVERLESSAHVLATGGSLNGAVLPTDSAPTAAPVTTNPRPIAPLPAPEVNGLPWPPGMAGALAGFIYRNAPRPVREVGIVAALGWLAGVCGKAFVIPGSGLNCYIVLVARSAVGKEAMHQGLSVLTQTLVNKGCVPAGRFVDYADFASGPALRKAMASNESFLNVSGEWGRKLKRLANDSQTDGPMQTLRTAMTDLYQKSSPQSIVGGMTYSKKEETVASINGVAYSMIGETTPGTFYDALTETMMEDGFLSRFTIVEYGGQRPAANKAVQREPDPELIDACATLVVTASKLLTSHRNVYVGRTDEAWHIMDAFDAECDGEINKTHDESWRQMWNRAHLKSMRIAALLACGDNPAMPCITKEHIEWAIDLVRRDIKMMRRKLEDGEIGTGDSSRERRVLKLCKEFLQGVTDGYHIPDGMVKQGIVPRKYIQQRCSRLSLFNGSKQGGIRALDETIRSLCDSGYLLEMDKAKAADDFGFQGRCYRITNLPHGLME